LHGSGEALRVGVGVGHSATTGMVAPPSQPERGPLQQHELEVEPSHFFPLSMHSISVTAWVCELEPRAPHSTTFLSLAHLQATAAQPSREPAPVKEDTPCCRCADGERLLYEQCVVEVKRMRTPSPSKVGANFPTTCVSARRHRRCDASPKLLHT
jgi:hypothetical protein